MTTPLKAWHVGDDIYAAESAEHAVREAMKRTDRTRKEIMQAGPISECSPDLVVYEGDPDDRQNPVKIGDIMKTWKKPGVLAEDHS